MSNEDILKQERCCCGNCWYWCQNTENPDTGGCYGMWPPIGHEKMIRIDTDDEEDDENANLITNIKFACVLFKDEHEELARTAKETEGEESWH